MDFVINGRKWMITGVPEASINIVMARTLDASGVDLGATMFFVDMDAPGFRVDRMLDTIDSNSPGGHAEVSFEDVHVTPDRVLGEDRRGFPQRPGAARAGAPDPLHALARRGAALPRDRRANMPDGGIRSAVTIGEHQGVGFMLADNEIDLHLSRLAIWHAAWLLDQHEHARDETSMSKVFCSEALGRVVDRSLQILGSIGITRDTVVERIYRDIRPFRIYDGPSEVHRHALARRIVSRNTQQRQLAAASQSHGTIADLRTALRFVPLEHPGALQHRRRCLRPACGGSEQSRADRRERPMARLGK